MQQQTSIFDLDVGGVRPFIVEDAADQCLSEAHALLLLLATALESSEVLSQQNENPIGDLRDGIKASAVRGIERLVSVALYCNDAARQRRR